MALRSDFNFNLPPHLIAQRPLADRESSKLLVIHPDQGIVAHSSVRELHQWLSPRTLLIPNEVRVRKARLWLRRQTGGGGEALLFHRHEDGTFDALVRPAHRLIKGSTCEILHPITQENLGSLTILNEGPQGERTVRLYPPELSEWSNIDRIGSLPLPPYITRAADDHDDQRYQTDFASDEGEAVAAPTAGLHFSKTLITELKQKGHDWAPIRLDVGLGTFRPILVDKIDDHQMHREAFFISTETSKKISEAIVGQRPIVCIGTTSLRTLETAWDGNTLLTQGESRLFLRPGHPPRVPCGLLTNFHLPESSLFILICSLLGTQQAHKIYAEAIRLSYRFFSYGDAMLIQERSQR